MRRSIDLSQQQQQRQSLQSQSQQQLNINNNNSMMNSSSSFGIFCHKHPGDLITHGCIEYNCESNTIMCAKCLQTDTQHTEEHRLSILPFSDYIQYIAAEIGKLAAPNTSFLHKNVAGVIQKEAYFHESFENQMKTQRDLLFKNIDEIGSMFVHHLERIKHQSEHYFAKQFETYKLNMLYFKQQYKGYNPEDTYTRYSDFRKIKEKVLVKSPLQAFHFLAGLRKSANLEGQVLSNLNYLAESIVSWNDRYPLVDQVLYDKHLKNATAIVQDMESDILLNLKEAPEMNMDKILEANQNLISYNKKTVRINSYKLFDQLKFDFQVVATMATMHTNSATAIVALSDDIAATSSYDRSIKLWRLQDGKLLKELHDKNSVTCLCVFKFANNKNREFSYYNEDDLTAIHQEIAKNPFQPISNLGLLLISGGLDKIVKIWDFDFSTDPSIHVDQPYGELKGHSGWITQIISLEDEQNIVCGDDTGELIVWSIFQQSQRFAASSGETVKIWVMEYRSDATRRLSKQFPLQLSDCVVERTFNLKTPVYSMSVPRSFRNIVVVGSKAGVLKYIDLNKNKMVTINTDHRDIIGDMIIIEKLKVSEKDFEYFHRNINFLLCGTKKLGLYNGYGNILENAPAANAEDFCTSSILPNRNMTLLKVHKRGKTSFIRIGVVSQFQSDFYSYQSSRTSLIHIKADFLDYL